MWILDEMTNTYILKCSHCEAPGNYHAAQQSVHLTCAACGAINAFEYDEERLGEICVRCGTRR